VDPLIEVLTAYHPTDPTEAADIARVRSLLEGADPWSRGQPLHVTGSALVVERASARVLLRWHARMRRWLQVGGHGDPGERDPWQVACREAREETGLIDLIPATSAPRPLPVQIVIVPVPAYGTEPAHEHADIRYVLATASPHDAEAESPTAQLRWVALEEAAVIVEEDNLRECIRRTMRLLAGPSPRSSPLD
jgi:8-oxo-dGTP pyrophosphatase MutT (NUDIX family)